MVRENKCVCNNYLFLFLLFCVFIFLSMNFFSFFNNLISENIPKLWNPFFNSFFILISQYIFDTKVLCFFSILFFLFSPKKNKIKSFIFLSIVGLTALISEGAKYIFGNSRPVNSLILESSFSFPSSHASISFVFFILIYFYFEEKFKNKNLFLSFNIFLILLVGFSRIYLNVHYFSDVLGGYILGAMILIFLKKIRYRSFDSLLGKLY